MYFEITVRKTASDLFCEVKEQKVTLYLIQQRALSIIVLPVALTVLLMLTLVLFSCKYFCQYVHTIQFCAIFSNFWYYHLIYTMHVCMYVSSNSNFRQKINFSNEISKSSLNMKGLGEDLAGQLLHRHIVVCWQAKRKNKFVRLYVMR